MAMLIMKVTKWLTRYELLVKAILIMIVIKWLASYDLLVIAMLLMIVTNWRTIVMSHLLWLY